MIEKMRNLKIISLLLLVSLMLAACGGAATTAAPTSANTSQLNCPVIVAAAVHLTGGTAIYDTPPVEGARLAVEDINAAGGVLGCQMTLLELGSGSSTAWYASRVGRVVSVEPDPQWHRQVSQSIEHLANVQLISDSIRGAFGRLSSESFDVVIVDHFEDSGDMSRLDALEELRSSVSIAVLDDSDRPAYSAADRLMSAWRVARYISYRSKPLAPTETTIYTR